MRMFLQPSRLVIAAMLGATGWAKPSAGAEEEKSIVPQGTLTDRVFADPRLCLDLDAPAEQFFREVPGHDLFQPDPEAVSLLSQSPENAVRRNGKIKGTMRELLDEPSRNIAAIEAERLFHSASREHASDITPPVKHFRVDGAIVYARTSGEAKSNDSITARLRRAASLRSSKDGIGLPSIDLPSMD